MRRVGIEPRENHEELVQRHGLVFSTIPRPDGSQHRYWHEDHCYLFSPAEISALHTATAQLLDLYEQATEHVIGEGRFEEISVPDWAVDGVVRSWRQRDPTVYGRMDFAFAGATPKLLEFNADTPAMLLESGFVQYHWFCDIRRRDATQHGQWNQVHDLLVDRWAALGEQRIGSAPVHFAHDFVESSGETWMTVAYMAMLARQAGLDPRIIQIEQLLWEEGRGFVDVEGLSIEHLYNLYPWDWLLYEEHHEGGDFALRSIPPGPLCTAWYEPLWKIMWSSKGMLAILWELFGERCPYLLAAHNDGPRDLTEWASKPHHSYEGANIAIVSRDGNVQTPGDFGQEDRVWQAYSPLGDFDGNHPTVSTWVVGDLPGGLCVRENDGLIVDLYSRFVPHLIELAASAGETGRAGRAQAPPELDDLALTA